MLYPNSVLKVSDNSGAKYIKCLQVNGFSQKKHFNVGDCTKVSVQEYKVTKIRKKRLSSKNLAKALILSTAKKYQRSNGFGLKFESNRAIMFNQNNQFLGTRVYGSSVKEVRTHPILGKVRIFIKKYF